MKNFLMVLVFLFGFYLTGHATDGVPRYSDYPVKSVYTGKAATLDLSDPGARMFRTRLSDALKEAPDFAGEYVLTMWGCGLMCRQYSFVSKRTGKLLRDGFGGENNREDVVGIRPHSRLVVTQDADDVPNNNHRILRFYVLEHGKFKLIKTIEDVNGE